MYFIFLLLSFFLLFLCYFLNLICLSTLYLNFLHHIIILYLFLLKLWSYFLYFFKKNRNFNFCVLQRLQTNLLLKNILFIYLIFSYIHRNYVLKIFYKIYVYFQKIKIVYWFYKCLNFYIFKHLSTIKNNIFMNFSKTSTKNISIL